MKLTLSFIKFLTFSNLFVSLCVTAFTHITYIIYNLPKDNILIVLTMVFSFTFFTYNGQRLYRLNQKILQPESIGERLKWVIKNKTALTIYSVIFGIIGFGCTLFINPYCFLILIPMGGLSIFYVIPLLPFYNKSPSLRDIPYLKIIVIAITWAIAIIWLPIIDSQPNIQNTLTLNLGIALLQNFLFVFAITLPFDVRDMNFDKLNHLKTIPQFLGIKKTIVVSELLLIGSLTLMAISNLKQQHLYGLLIGYVITMIIIAFTNNKRKEIFYAGLVEGSIIILYGCVLISEFLLSL